MLDLNAREGGVEGEAEPGVWLGGNGAGTGVRADFSDTRWSVVLRAGGAGDGEERRRAMEELCRRYWPPIYAWLRHQGHSAHDAEDLVQSLFEEILGGEVLAGLERDRGRFRSFLIALAKNRAVDEYRRRRAEKRGGRVVMVVLDQEMGEALAASAREGDSPEVAFDRNWAKVVIGGAMEELEANYEAAGRGELFRVLRPVLFGATGEGGYEAMGAALAMSRGAVAMSVKRLRERFGELVAQRVADTVGGAGEVREEVRYLLSLFANG